MTHPLGMGAEAIHIAKRLKNKDQITVLMALTSSSSSWDEYGAWYYDFTWLMNNTGMTRSTVRRNCRALTRKGLASYQKGLWSDDGTPAGAGYGATVLGKVVAEILSEDKTVPHQQEATGDCS